MRCSVRDGVPRRYIHSRVQGEFRSGGICHTPHPYSEQHLEPCINVINSDQLLLKGSLSIPADKTAAVHVGACFQDVAHAFCCSVVVVVVRGDHVLIGIAVAGDVPIELPLLPCDSVLLVREKRGDAEMGWNGGGGGTLTNH